MRNLKSNKDKEEMENMLNKIHQKHSNAEKKRELKLENIKTVALLAEKGKPIAHLGALNEPSAAALGSLNIKEQKQIWKMLVWLQDAPKSYL